MSAPENPPAFPNSVQPDFQFAEQGMTLRDWFAGQALPEAMRYAFANESSPFRIDFLPEEWAAKIAGSVADAMLAERAKVQS